MIDYKLSYGMARAKFLSRLAILEAILADLRSVLSTLKNEVWVDREEEEV